MNLKRNTFQTLTRCMNSTNMDASSAIFPCRHWSPGIRYNVFTTNHKLLKVSPCLHYFSIVGNNECPLPHCTESCVIPILSFTHLYTASRHRRFSKMFQCTPQLRWDQEITQGFTHCIHPSDDSFFSGAVSVLGTHCLESTLNGVGVWVLKPWNSPLCLSLSRVCFPCPNCLLPFTLPSVSIATICILVREKQDDVSLLHLISH